MGFWVFLGSFIAVAVILTILITAIVLKIRSFSKRVFGSEDILEALEEIDTTKMETPRSLSGCDSLLLPKILKDFPDFDVNLAKTYARDYLKDRFGKKQSFTIHNVVITKYLPSAAQKTIVFQAATAHREENRTIQKRYNLHYCYILPDASDTVAATCPNCGGPLGYGVTTCPFCDSRVANVLGNSWCFTECIET